jgi:DNA-binding MarR family transcriptional regulator
LASTAENEFALNRWEVQILKCIKSKAMTEKKIAKELSFDITIVSQLITDLMLQGYIERFRKRKMYFSSREYFSATIDGLMALEASQRNFRGFWNHLSSMLKDQSEKMVLELSNRSVIFRFTYRALRGTYAISRFLIK